jgi:hypothetical protein
MKAMEQKTKYLWTFSKKGSLSIVLTDDGVHTKRMLFGKKYRNKIYSKFDSKHLFHVYYSQLSQKRRCFYSVVIESALENASGKVHHKP